MEENKEKVLDLTILLPTMLKGWRYYVAAFAVAVLLAFVFVFTIPRYYSCKVMLAPELSEESGGLSSLMSSFGLGSIEGSEDAISPMLYPDLMESRNFVTSLFSVKITTKDESVSTTYYEYLKKHTKHSWYMNCLGQIFKLFESKGGQTQGVNVGKYAPSYMLTKEQDEIAQAIAGKIKYDYDKKTGVVSVSVTDQDPLVCALIADTVSTRLQEFITDYRTKKARADLEYAERIYSSAKTEYEAANLKYAGAVDANRNAISESVKARIQELGNDRDLKYQTLTAINQKLQASKAKLQEDTPVITMLQGPYVPVKPAGPKRVFLTLTLIFMAFLGVTLYLFSKANK